jgi:hypothetical protein
MVRKVTALRVMVQLRSGGHVLKVSLVMGTHQEVCLHLRTTTHPTVVTHSRDHQEAAWAGTKGRALRPILHIRVVVLTTTSRDLNHMIASHQATLLDQGTTTVMGNLRLLDMDNLRIRNMRLNRTMAMGMVILDTMLRLRTSTMGSHLWPPSKAILNRQILMLGLHTVDRDNGLPEVLRLQMAPTRHHRLHLMGHPPSNLLLMAKHMAQQLHLMGMLNRATHSRVGKHQLHMARMHQQHQAILSKAHSKVAMHSTHKPNQHMVIKQLKPIRTMATRELQQIPTMEVPTHNQDMELLLLQLVSLVMLLHQQLASLQHMARQDTPNQLQTLQVMISLQQHQLRADTLHLPQTHSLLQQRGCHHSLLLDMPVGSGQHEPLSNFTDSKILLDT